LLRAGSRGIESHRADSLVRALLAELGHELWIGDSAKISASEVRKPEKPTSAMPGSFSICCCEALSKIWVPTPAATRPPAVALARHKLVCLRTMLTNSCIFSP